MPECNNIKKIKKIDRRYMLYNNNRVAAVSSLIRRILFILK